MSNKLYTEEQVRIMLGKARLHNMDDSEMFTDDYLIKQQTPIELPTDRQLRKMAKTVCNGHQHAMRYNQMLICCFRMSKSLINKIQGGNNEPK